MDQHALSGARALVRSLLCTGVRIAHGDERSIGRGDGMTLRGRSPLLIEAFGTSPSPIGRDGHPSRSLQSICSSSAPFLASSPLPPGWKEGLGGEGSICILTMMELSVAMVHGPLS